MHEDNSLMISVSNARPDVLCVLYVLDAESLWKISYSMIKKSYLYSVKSVGVDRMKVLCLSFQHCLGHSVSSSTGVPPQTDGGHMFRIRPGQMVSYQLCKQLLTAHTHTHTRNASVCVRLT